MTGALNFYICFTHLFILKDVQSWLFTHPFPKVACSSLSLQLSCPPAVCTLHMLWPKEFLHLWWARESSWNMLAKFKLLCGCQHCSAFLSVSSELSSSLSSWCGSICSLASYTPLMFSFYPVTTHFSTFSTLLTKKDSCWNFLSLEVTQVLTKGEVFV